MIKLDKRNKQCDRSGEMFEVLYKQYEWAGDSKIWTGFWVGAPYLDVPNEQKRTPIIKIPKLVKDPRPFRAIETEIIPAFPINPIEV